MVRKNKVSPEKATGFNKKWRKDTESILKDRLFNKIVDKYSRHGNIFNFSDRFVWTGALYVLPEIFGYILFFLFFFYLAMLSFKRYGEFRTYIFMALLIMWRLNIMLKYLAKVNKKFGPDF